MADDPNKKGADAKRVSEQEHEKRYQKEKLNSAGERGASKGGNTSKASSQKETKGRGNTSEERT